MTLKYTSYMLAKNYRGTLVLRELCPFYTLTVLLEYIGHFEPITN